MAPCLSLAAALVGCGPRSRAPESLTRAQIDAIEVREVLAPADRAFAVTRAAMFRCGYELDPADPARARASGTTLAAIDPVEGALGDTLEATLSVLTLMTISGGSAVAPRNVALRPVTLAVEVGPEHDGRTRVRARVSVEGRAVISPMLSDQFWRALREFVRVEAPGGTPEAGEQPVIR